MNPYEKQGLLLESVKDAEWRLGSYLCMDGCEKTDRYAQTQISLIKKWTNELEALLKEEITVGSPEISDKL
jgi:hypothetical protein